MTLLSPTPYQLLIFDWDGTLMDSGAYIVDCVKKAATDKQYALPSDEAIRNIIGLSMPIGLQSLFPNMNDDDCSDLLARYREHFFGNNPRPIDLFPHTYDTLGHLRDIGFLLCVATGKGRHGLNLDLQASQLGSFFVATRCADESASKPSPQMVLELLEEMDISPDKALVIGDTEYDIQMANRAGVEVLGVTYGMHDRARLLESGAKACIDDITQLPIWLETLNKERKTHDNR